MAPADPLRILIVENHPDTVKYLSLYLEQLGHVVSVAGTAAAALEFLTTNRTDLVISDIGLPDTDGWIFLGQIPEPRPYAVAISGYGTARDTERSREAGFQHHLAKPFLPADLEPILRDAANNRHRDTC